jgi:hypothetical protein
MDKPQVLGTIPWSTRRSTKEGREESNQRTKQPGSGGLSGQVGRTVRTGRADCPAGYRGLSAPVPRTVRPRATDRPLNSTEPPVENPEKRTVCGEHADCPPDTRGLSARHTRTVRNLVQRKLKATTNRKRRRARTRRTHDEHYERGSSARPSRTVLEARTELKIARPRKSTLPIHHRITQMVEAIETRVWGHEKRQPRMLYPQKFCLLTS